jgi:chromosome segregation ATPase
MSIAVVGLNLLLVVLLLAALAFGWRLERRLKALKDSHEGFARAVDDLDAAAARAEQGLADLRAATDEAADTLAARIETAKALTARLEQGMGAATDRAANPATTIQELREQAAASRDRVLPHERVLETRERSVEAFVRQEPSTTPRSRARVDDDLFEPDPEAGRLRAISGGRR